MPLTTGRQRGRGEAEEGGRELGADQGEERPTVGRAGLVVIQLPFLRQWYNKLECLCPLFICDAGCNLTECNN